jgi:hypothetical protein
MNRNKKDRLIPFSLFVSVLIIALAFMYRAGLSNAPAVSSEKNPHDLGVLKERMIAAGVIDEAKFESASTTLNLLWALGLSNKNRILEEGPMTDPRYGGAGGFASTGGWTIAKGDAMDHYSMHDFVNLTPAQQELVERVSKNIYRPCCNNPAHFPDCNHGMAMLGLLELAASRGASETEMYDEALKANTSWFPDAYDNIAAYLDRNGTGVRTASSKEILSAEFSSASGYQKVLASLEPVQNKGSSCGV